MESHSLGSLFADLPPLANRPSPSSSDRRARTCPEKEKFLMATVVFENASRVYPGSTTPAVNKLNLEVKDGEYVIPWLEGLGINETLSPVASLIGVTLVIAYFSLVFGELVPKRLALFRTEQISLASAPIIDTVATLFRPIIWLLSHSTDLVVRIFGVDPKEQRTAVNKLNLEVKDGEFLVLVGPSGCGKSQSLSCGCASWSYCLWILVCSTWCRKTR